MLCFFAPGWGMYTKRLCHMSFILSPFHIDSWQKTFCFAEPEPPIRLEKMEETTNKISLALEIQEEGLRRKPGRCFAVCSSGCHICLCNWSQLMCHTCESSVLLKRDNLLVSMLFISGYVYMDSYIPILTRWDCRQAGLLATDRY